MEEGERLRQLFESLDQWNLNCELFTAQERLFTRFWLWGYKLGSSFHLSLNYDREGDLF